MSGPTSLLKQGHSRVKNIIDIFNVDYTGEHHWVTTLSTGHHKKSENTSFLMYHQHTVISAFKQLFRCCGYKCYVALHANSFRKKLGFCNYLAHLFGLSVHKNVGLQRCRKKKYSATSLSGK